VTDDPAGAPVAKGPNLYRTAWFFYLALALVGAIWLSFQQDPVGPAIVWRLLGPPTWWLELPLGLAAGGLLLGLWQLLHRLLPQARELEDALAELVRGLPAGDMLALALVSGFAEELFFRGAVQGAWGPLVATVLFAALHPGPGRSFWVWMLFAAVAGALFAAIVVWRGNLLAAITGHVLVNAVNLRRMARRRSASRTA
jgi:uncharacterized protein